MVIRGEERGKRGFERSGRADGGKGPGKRSLARVGMSIVQTVFEI